MRDNLDSKKKNINFKRNVLKLWSKVTKNEKKMKSVNSKMSVY